MQSDMRENSKRNTISIQNFLLRDMPFRHCVSIQLNTKTFSALRGAPCDLSRFVAITSSLNHAKNA